MKIRIRSGSVHSDDIKNRALCAFITVYYLGDALNISIQRVFHLSSTMVSVFKAGIAVVCVLFLLFALLKDRRMLSTMVGIEILGLAPFIYTFIVGVPLSSIQGWIVHFLLICLPLAYCSYCITDTEMLYNMLLKMSWPVGIMLLLYMRTTWTGSEHTMTVSYGLLPVALIFLASFFENKKRVPQFILAIIIIMILAVVGSRGPLVCVVAFFALYVLTLQINRNKKIVLVGSILIAGVLLYIYFDQLIIFVVDKLSIKGYYSRSLSLLLSGDFTESRGRSKLWDIVVELIKERPWLGWGIGGAVSRMNQPYPHQFFFDPPLAFGIPIGAIMIATVLRYLTALFTEKKVLTKNLLMVFFCCGFVSLMFSGSVFSNYYFYILLGLSIRSCKEYRYLKNRPAEILD